MFLNCNRKIFLNPFHPAGPFLAPKSIILNDLINVMFILYLIVLYVEQDVKFMWQSYLGLKNWKIDFQI